MQTWLNILIILLFLYNYPVSSIYFHLITFPTVLLLLFIWYSKNIVVLKYFEFCQSFAYKKIDVFIILYE